MIVKVIINYVFRGIFYIILNFVDIKLNIRGMFLKNLLIRILRESWGFWGLILSCIM